MPVMKFSNINESDRSLNSLCNGFANYNWGYDAHHFFSPEGWYSTQPDDPYARIYELQQLAQAMHQANLGVIYDVVYNHTYLAETLENIAPGWYYRQNHEMKISGHTGAGAGLETRLPMTRKLIIESLIHYVKYYGADGFRFDLVSFFDHETIKLIRQEAGKTYDTTDYNQLILHGEGWNFTDLPENQACTKSNPPDKSLHFALFNDTLRDGLMGHLLNRGSIHGKTDEMSRLASGISAGIKDMNPGPVPFNRPDFFAPYNMFASEPEQCLNLISIHDGFTLWDKLNLTVNCSAEKRIQLFCQAATVLFTSQGKIIWHGGEEFLRSKPLGDMGKEPWRAHSTDFAESREGIRFFQENSFGSPDFTNMIRRSPWGIDGQIRMQQVSDYISGLIDIRKKIPSLHFTSSEEINENFSFIHPIIANTSNNSFLFSSFKAKDMKTLILRFINGPAFATCYLCGEVHPKGTDGNPPHNPFALTFDANGKASYTFSAHEIQAFDIGKWGSNLGLKLKLTFQPGAWDSPDYAYTAHGNNIIFPQAVNEKGEVVIDLSIPDFTTPSFPEPTSHMAFRINVWDTSSGFSKRRRRFCLGCRRQEVF
jgi:pullulanase